MKYSSNIFSFILLSIIPALIVLSAILTYPLVLQNSVPRLVLIVVMIVVPLAFQGVARLLSLRGARFWLGVAIFFAAQVVMLGWLNYWF